jgi:transposase
MGGYSAVHPGGYGYSRFCELYREFEHRLSPTMRQHHVAGDKVFVDYSGKTVPIVDRLTGEIAPAQIFVAVLGASNYTYAEASWSQALPDWIGAHVRMFGFSKAARGPWWYRTISRRASTSRLFTTQAV